MNILIGVMISMLIMSSNLNDSNDPNDVVNEVLFEEIEAIISDESDLTYSIYDNQYRFDFIYMIGEALNDYRGLTRKVADLEGVDFKVLYNEFDTMDGMTQYESFDYWVDIVSTTQVHAHNAIHKLTLELSLKKYQLGEISLEELEESLRIYKKYSKITYGRDFYHLD